MEACTCDYTLGNLGVPGCKSIFQVPHKFVFTSYYKSDGTINELDLSGDLDSTQFNALVNQSDSNLKWFPTPDIELNSITRGENVYETLPSGKKVYIKEGELDISFAIVEVDPVFLGKLKGMGCKQIGIFEITRSKDLVGMKGSSSTKLAPIKMDSETFSALFERMTYDASQKVQVKMQYDSSMRDEDLRMVKYSEMSYDLHNLNGLIDIIGATPTNISTTSFKMKMNTLYGSPINPFKVKGLVAGDFALYNLTDSASVTISTCTESNGEYTFTFTAQTSADVLRLSCTADGFDDTTLETVTITIP